MRRAPDSTLIPGRTQPTPEPRVSRLDAGRLARSRARQRRRRLAVTALLVGAAALVGIDLLRGAPERIDPSRTSAQPSAAPSTVAEPSAPPSPAASPAASPVSAPLLRMPGEFPKSGPGTWTYAPGQGPVLGAAGGVRRFRVAAESNIAKEELAEFARLAEETLGDPRSWIAGRQFRLQRVPSGVPYDFTIYLATGETTYQLCATGGMNTKNGSGESFTSCRLSGRVIVNLNRWRTSIPDYVDTKVPLYNYRQYVINHETGHELGHGHEACPGKGKLAPTMQQQTFGLKSCVANAWPYVDGKRYAGSYVP